MKKNITIYHDIENDSYLTEEDAEMLYDDMIYDSYSEGIPCMYNHVSDFINHMTFSGKWDVITAHLSSSQKVYPYYFTEDGIGFQTALDMYMAWESMPYMDRVYNCPTFAEFLDIPQNDRNAVMSWGFEK